MKKWIERAGRMAVALLCTGPLFGCAQQGGEPAQSPQQEVQETAASESEIEPQEGTEPSSQEQISTYNERRFFEEAQDQGAEGALSKALYQRLLDDDIFEDGRRVLTGLRIGDIDGNGQQDMLVMVLDAPEMPFYGSGTLWFYMNDDAPWRFEEEECSFSGIFDAFWADVDNDEQVEIIFSAQGTGCGAVGDSYKAVFKYGDHKIEQMALPSDLEETYDCGIRVSVFRETEPDSYSAYCEYLDEQLFFESESIKGIEASSMEAPSMEETSIEQAVGGEVRGFYDLCVVEYEGKRMLQASEYLHGEGGIVHNVATAKFLITWEEDGTPVVARWWIEEDKDW